MTALTLLVVFGAGVLSFASPCVLPLVPVWTALAVGAAAERPGAIVWSTAWFVAGFALLFALVGAAAGGAAGVLDPSASWLPRVGGALLVVCGLAMIAVPGAGFGREARLIGELPRWAKVHPSAPVRAGVAGVAFGAAWTPCVGPILGSALVAAGASGTAARGAALLGVYALGIGVPFLVAALALTAAPTMQRRLAPAAARLRFVGGVLLAAIGVLLVAGASEGLVAPVAQLLGAA